VIIKWLSNRVLVSEREQLVFKQWLNQLVKASDDNSCENQPEYDTVSIKLDHNLDIPMSSNPAYA
jgi:hypothetical protein